jgi:hypothetical protein
MATTTLTLTHHAPMEHGTTQHKVSLHSDSPQHIRFTTNLKDMRTVFLLSSLFTLAKGKYNVYVGGFGASVENKNIISPALPGSRNNDILSLGVIPIDTDMVSSCDDGTQTMISSIISSLRGGGAAALNPFPAGYNPLGYRLTALGITFLQFDGSLDSDVGRFLSTLKGGQRKSMSVMKEQWLEIVRVSKKAQSMRIYRRLDDMIDFCLKAGFVD